MFPLNLIRKGRLSLLTFQNIILKLKYSSESNRAKRKALAEVLGITSVRVTQLLKQYKSFQKIDSNDIYSNVKKMNELKIDMNDLIDNPVVLTLTQSQIENRKLLLEECGFNNISTHIITTFLHCIKKRISLMKSYNFLRSDINVADNIYSYLETPLDSHPVPNYSDNMILLDVINTVREHYLRQKLQFPDKQSYDHIIKTYGRIQYKSFRIVNENIQILREKLKFPNERIHANGYLLHSNPINTRRILAEVPTIAGLPIVEILYKHPKILMTNVDTIKKTIQILHDNHIKDESIIKCFNVFTLSSKSLENRIIESREIPQLKVLASNDQILKLIAHHEKAKSRLQFIDKINVKNASLSILSGTDENFKRYINDGVDKTRGDDVVNYLKYEFRNTDTDTIRSELLKHPFWFHVPLLQVAETYEYLCKKYRNEELKQVLQILLYPKDKLDYQLKTLRRRPELDRKWITPLQELNLCLYYIEKPYHFSGDGVWKNENDKNEK